LNSLISHIYEYSYPRCAYKSKLQQNRRRAETLFTQE
jgi:hypothetical protein